MQGMNHHPKILKGWIIGLFMVITIIDLLGNHRETENSKHLIKRPVFRLQAGFPK